MANEETVYSADGAFIGLLRRSEATELEVEGDGKHYRIPAEGVAYTHESRHFLKARNRAEAEQWRIDLQQASGLRGWWYRRVLGPSPRRPGGPLGD